jgi:gamma-tubulin complex component 2
VRVSIASSGLYEWLLKVISVSGVIGGEEGEGVPDKEAKKDRDKGLGMPGYLTG